MMTGIVVVLVGLDDGDDDVGDDNVGDDNDGDDDVEDDNVGDDDVVNDDVGDDVDRRIVCNNQVSVSWLCSLPVLHKHHLVQ